MINESLSVGTDALLTRARQLLAAEQRALALLSDGIDHNLVEAARVLARCSGRIVVTGVGKSGIAARKLAATLSSLQRPAHFLHAGDALHGDLGAVSGADVLIAISVSGNTRELAPIIDRATAIGATTIAITAAMFAPLARGCDYVLLTECPDDDHAAVPMASTIASIALGDVLAMLASLSARDERSELAELHPAGDLGRRRRSVDLVAHSGERVPIVAADADASRIIEEITAKGFGITGVSDAQGRLIGTISDGDVRRHFADLNGRTAGEVMETHPVTVSAGTDVGTALDQMRAHRISALFVVTPGTDRVEAVVHLQDLMRIGVI